ncbi:hypothetical protein B0H14DRAFT_2635240 [Mycena olivaceomarginata]|nr:hypothetical protein B0H14DRAFT_2635240 [Mycena olivaceomarginata]
MPTIRRPPCSYSYTELVAHSCSPYKLEGPGCLYFPLRGTEISDINAFLDGTVLTQAQFNALQINAGHTAKFERQFGEYRACGDNRPHDHIVVFWARCYAPERQRTERSIHLKLKAKHASLRAKKHREFYSLANAGDLEGFKSLVEEVYLDLGVPFVWEQLEDRVP